MAHSDDHGLVLPPKLAPTQVVVVPVFKTSGQLIKISEVIVPILKDLESHGISLKYDDREIYKPGWKFSEYEFKGVPLRLTLGPRDLEQGTIEIARRDTLAKSVIPIHRIVETVPKILEEIQNNLFTRSLHFRDKNTYRADTWDEFVDIMENKGGFVYAHWDGTPETEAKIKETSKAAIRVIPLHNPKEKGACIYSGRPSYERVLFARAY